MWFAVRVYSLVGAADNDIAGDDFRVNTPIDPGPVGMLSKQANPAWYEQFYFLRVGFHAILLQ
jgi:hypothetical protein